MRGVTLSPNLILRFHQMLTEKPAYESYQFITKRHPEISADADRKAGL
ncbi:hypothetical protein [Desulfonema magnum]|nr:hypothetical protein [Desulfonema magnum]